MSLDRRRFLTGCSKLGFASTLLPGVLYTLAAQAGTEAAHITPEMIDQAALIAGVPVAADQKAAMLSVLNANRKAFDQMRALNIPNSVAPALIFDPVPPGQQTAPPPPGTDPRKSVQLSPATAPKDVPKDLNELAFATVRDLGDLIRRKKVSSLNLTEMYLARLKKYDPLLHFVVTLTEERALVQAKSIDKEIAAGRYRGPLHGIPWGAKDLLAVKGYRTTWGAGGFEEQVIDQDATVVQRLDAAGAVLIAKLSLGSLAQGDRWFGGQTRNPWNPEQGSSGSSAGPGSATSAGCVGFSIGSETTGSISGPATRCGVTGLRPTFGFVPRTGAMTLAWSLDKLGPLCRSVEDCALVLQAIWGPDGQDEACKNANFQWNADFDWKKLRVGYLKDDFEKPWPGQPIPPLAGDATVEEKRAYDRRKAAEPAQLASREYDRKYDLAALEVFHKMGVQLIPVTFPDFPYDALRGIINAESAAAFDSLTLSGRDKLLTAASGSTWPNSWRAARLYPAVEYIQANRVRTLAIQAFAKLFEQIDVIVAPTSGPSNQVAVTNQTGHPAVIIPNGVRGTDAPAPVAFPGPIGVPGAAPPGGPGGGSNQGGGPGTPLSLTFLGGLFKDAETCAFAHAYQQATGFHRLHPPLA